eukprot:3877803-Alexandrium_andersonii.AAC.2
MPWSTPPRSVRKSLNDPRCCCGGGGPTSLRAQSLLSAANYRPMAPQPGGSFACGPRPSTQASKQASATLAVMVLADQETTKMPAAAHDKPHAAQR